MIFRRANPGSSGYSRTYTSGRAFACCSASLIVDRAKIQARLQASLAEVPERELYREPGRRRPARRKVRRSGPGRPRGSRGAPAGGSPGGRGEETACLRGGPRLAWRPRAGRWRLEPEKPNRKCHKSGITTRQRGREKTTKPSLPNFTTVY